MRAQTVRFQGREGRRVPSLQQDLPERPRLRKCHSTHTRQGCPEFTYPGVSGMGVQQGALFLPGNQLERDN